MKDNNVIVYSANPRNRSIIHLWFESIKIIISGRELAYRFASRTIKGRYRESFLGLFWALFSPLVSAVVWIFLKDSSVIELPESHLPYPLFVIIGMMLWRSFLDSFQSPLTSITQVKNTLAKLNFNRVSLILSGLYVVIFNLLLKVFLIILLLWYYEIPIGYAMLMAPISIIFFMLLGFSLGTLLLPFSMMIADVQKIITLIVSVWMFITPVIFPYNTEGVFGNVIKYNPASPFLDFSRQCITGSIHYIPEMLIPYSIATVFLFVFSITIFRISLPIIIEKIGS